MATNKPKRTLKPWEVVVVIDGAEVVGVVLGVNEGDKPSAKRTYIRVGDSMIVHARDDEISKQRTRPAPRTN